MKKKLLSLALVLAMALSLLPTAVFAEATAGAFVGNGSFAVSDEKTGGTLSWKYKAGTDESGDATTPAFTVTQKVGSGNATTITSDSNKPTKGTGDATGDAYTLAVTGLSAELTDKVTFTITDAETPANSITVEYTPEQTQQPGSPTTIASFTASITTSPVVAGKTVNIAIASAVIENEEDSDKLTAAKNALEVKSATWTAKTASNAAKAGEGDATTAPTTAGNYEVTVTADVEDASKTAYQLTTKTYKITSVTVTEDQGGGDDPEEKPITVTAEFVDAQNIRVTWTNPEGVPANTTYNVIVANESSTINKTVTGATSPATVSLDSAVPSGTEVSVTVSGLSGQSVVAQGNSGHITYTAPVTPTNPTTPTTPAEDNKAPSTNSQGVPVASEVNTVNQANQAISTLQNTNSDTLSERLMTNEAAASSFASLENTVKAVKGITVSVEPSSAAPSAVRSGVSVTGAAFNAVGSNVSLVVDAPSKAYSFSSGYQISMTMTGVNNTARLNVPVVITLPLPSDVNASRVVVLHYHNGSSNPSVITPVVSGSYLRFPVTGFSDFVITDRYDSGVPVSGVPRSVRNNSDDLSDVLPAIAALLSGDGVFADVPGTHWASKEIRWARDGGLMSGYENGQFRPWASTTRQQLWMVLARLSGTRPSDMAMARQWAINTGVSDGSNPTGELSRQQLVTMLYRFAKTQGVNVSASSKLGGYTDNGKVASYAKEALSWANAKGIMGGDSKGKLNPEGTATRAHFAVFLYRYSKL